MAQSPHATALLCDFDGTLADIVDDPAQATARPGAGDILRRLARRFALVAVISGRTASFLVDQLGSPGESGLALAGLYGLERAAPDGTVEVDPSAATWARAVAEADGRARRELPGAVEVEFKGLSVTLHTRTAPDHEAIAAGWANTAAAALGLVVHPGRRSVELRPPVPIDKGTTVHQLVRSRPVRHAAFFGDDAGDVPAFDTLHRLAEQPDGLESALAVASDSPECPPAVRSAADVVLAGPAAVVEALRELADVSGS